MKSLCNHINESLSDILDNNFVVHPYQWDEFKKLANKRNMSIDIDQGTEIVYNKKEVIARYDIDTLLVYTSIDKGDFFKGVLHKQPKKLDKYFVNEAVTEFASGDKVKITKGKHKNSTGKIEYLYTKTAIIDVSKNTSIEANLSDLIHI